MPSLVYLQLSNTNITADGIKNIQKIKFLEGISITTQSNFIQITFFQKIFKFLISNQKYGGRIEVGYDRVGNQWFYFSHLAKLAYKGSTISFLIVKENKNTNIDI